jgi:hypothetical protein
MDQGRSTILIDGTAGVGAITAPLWLQEAAVVVQLAVLAGGALLLALRIAIAWRDLRNQRRSATERDPE